MSEPTKSLEQLKAEAYDLIAAKEYFTAQADQVQRALNAKNQEIQAATVALQPKAEAETAETPASESGDLLGLDEKVDAAAG
jgi:hypothetical protein